VEREEEESQEDSSVQHHQNWSFH